MIPHGILDTDRVLPTGNFTSPASGATVSGTITLTISAHDNDKVSSVQFQIDGTNIGAPDTTSPYSVNYDTTTILNGNHTLQAVITDRGGNVTVVSQSVNVENMPVVTLTSPGNGANVSGTITLSANVTSYDAGISVQFYVDGAAVGAALNGAGTQSVSYDTHLLSAGNHTFQVGATDSHGNNVSSAVTASISNSVPGPGYVVLGEIYNWNDNDQAYEGGRSGPVGYDGTGGNWIWSNTGQKIGYLNLPGNPDPTHYQMRAWFWGERIEGGTHGNVVYVDLLVGGNWYEPWVNGPTYGNASGPLGPVCNVGGGEQIGAKRWCTQVGVDGCICFNVGAYYDFVPKSGYQS